MGILTDFCRGELEGGGGVNLQQEPIPKELSVAFRSIFIHNGNRLSGVQFREYSGEYDYP